MYKILTLNNISVAGLERLPREAYEVASEMQHPDGILVRSQKMHDMDLPASVKAIGRAGAGVNNIPVDKMSARGIAVFNAPGANANAVKELVIAGMLLGARNIAQAWDFARGCEGTDAEINKAVEAGKKNFVGFELPGRTLGVIGLGMHVIGYDPDITVQRAWQMSADVQHASSVDDLLSHADFVTFHVPLVEGTRGMINEERIRLLKDRAILLNFARDGIVDNDAVCNALDSGKLFAYVCDFPSNRLKNHPRVITLPHLGASTNEAEENCAVMVADQLREYLEHGNVRNSVNFPEIAMPRGSGYRVCVVNANVPNMLGQISTALAAAGHNIIDMINKSRGELAVTLVDVESEITEQCVQAIAATKGVLSVRILQPVS